MKRILLTLAVVLTTLVASAQSNGYWWIGAQGGANMTINPEFNNFKQISPMGALSLGYSETKAGVRLNVSGLNSRSGINFLNQEDGKYKYNYVTADVDFLLNLRTIFGKKEVYPWTVNLIAGVGYNRLWNNDNCKEEVVKGILIDLIESDIAPRNNVNLRTGLQFDFNISKHWSVNIEGDMNWWLTSDGRTFVNDNRQLELLAGLTYKFGCCKPKAKAEPVVATVAEPEYVTAAVAAKKVEEPVKPVVKEEPKPVVKEEPKPVVAPAPKKLESMTKNVFFTIGKSSVADHESEINEAAEWLKSHETATAVVTGYADAGTGSAAINKKISEQRATKVADALKAKGISADRITVDSKGDSVQPFAENDQNRVVIIQATEK